MQAMRSITVLTPTGTLGYGFDFLAFKRGMDFSPDVIAVDAGSTDPGPYYLGSGKPLVSRFSTKHELEIILTAARFAQIPVIIGSAGGAGTKYHVDWTAEIVREIAMEKKLKFRLATISADIPVERVKEAIQRNEIRQFEASFNLNVEILEKTTSLVAQMGYEPIVKALEDGAEVIIAGRSADDCVIASYPIWCGINVAQSIHMGKILECGAFSAEPFAMDVMLGFVSDDHFVLEPGSKNRYATRESVAAHSLYERENPYIQKGPGHQIDLHKCQYEQIDKRRVRVTGASYERDNEYWIKLEGAAIIGFRTIAIAGVRCPTMIEKIDFLLEKARKKTYEYFSSKILNIEYHVYGRNGVMRDREPQKTISSHELGLIIEVVADDQETANSVCHHLSGTLLHDHWTGQVNTSGNIAFPYSPSEIDSGPVYNFSAYHLMKTPDPLELFPITFEDI